VVGRRENRSEIYIGNKKIGAYLGTISVSLMRGNKKINLLARGKKISKAVDLAEIARREFNLEYGTIETYSENMKDGRVISAIRIELIKKV